MFGVQWRDYVNVRSLLSTFFILLKTKVETMAICFNIAVSIHLYGFKVKFYANK